jgi:hypothetical protein
LSAATRSISLTDGFILKVTVVVLFAMFLRLLHSILLL